MLVCRRYGFLSFDGPSMPRLMAVGGNSFRSPSPSLRVFIAASRMSALTRQHRQSRHGVIFGRNDLARLGCPRRRFLMVAVGIVDGRAVASRAGDIIIAASRIAAPPSHRIACLAKQYWLHAETASRSNGAVAEIAAPALRVAHHACLEAGAHFACRILFECAAKCLLLLFAETQPYRPMPAAVGHTLGRKSAQRLAAA